MELQSVPMDHSYLDMNGKCEHMPKAGKEEAMGKEAVATCLLHYIDIYILSMGDEQVMPQVENLTGDWLKI